MSVATIKDHCDAAAIAFEGGNQPAALAQLRAVTALVEALPRPHHARMMWLVGMAWCNRSVLWAIEAESEAKTLAPLDPDAAAVGYYQLARLAHARRLPADAARLSAALLASVGSDQGPAHPQYFEWERRLASLIDSSS